MGKKPTDNVITVNAVPQNHVHHHHLNSIHPGLSPAKETKAPKPCLPHLMLPLIFLGLIPALIFGAKDDNFTVIGSRVLGTHEQAHTAAVRPSCAGYGRPIKEVEEAHGLV
jgi:hypothetical protein